MLKGEPASGASQAALDLIQDQQRAHLGTTRPQRFHPVGVGDANACIALDGLKQHACGAFGDVFQGRKIVQPNVSNIREQRAKGVFLLLVSTEGKCACGATVVTAIEGDHLCASRHTAGEFERGFVGFGGGGKRVKVAAAWDWADCRYSP